MPHHSVLRAFLYLIPYALVAAVSPLALTATLTVMATGRVKALGFGIGFVLGQIATCALAVQFGFALAPNRQPRYPTLQSTLELALGVTLLCLAVRVRGRGLLVKQQGESSRSKKVLERLGRVHLLTAFAAGLVLGIGGPKRLVLTALAAASIVASGGQGSNENQLVLWYSLLATSLVWAAVLAFVIFGTRAIEEIDIARQRLSHHQPAVTFYALLFVGALLVIAGADGAI